MRHPASSVLPRVLTALPRNERTCRRSGEVVCGLGSLLRQDASYGSAHSTGPFVRGVVAIWALMPDEGSDLADPLLINCAPRPRLGPSSPAGDGPLLEHLRDRGDIRRVREEKFHDDERGGAAGTLDHRDEFQVVHGVDLIRAQHRQSANVLDAPCWLLPHCPADAGDEGCSLIPRSGRPELRGSRPPDIDDPTDTGTRRRLQGRYWRQFGGVRPC